MMALLSGDSRPSAPVYSPATVPIRKGRGRVSRPGHGDKNRYPRKGTIKKRFYPGTWHMATDNQAVLAENARLLVRLLGRLDAPLRHGIGQTWFVARASTSAIPPSLL